MIDVIQQLKDRYNGARIARRALRMKRDKLMTGLMRTWFERDYETYAPQEWFDANVYDEGVGDALTIGKGWSELSTRYHYASVELIILRYLRNHGLQVQGARVFDIGSGAGHWLDFYRSLGAAECIGVDIAESSAAYLNEHYAGDDAVHVHHGRFQDHVGSEPGGLDFVNAIGVMFHVVEEEWWREGIAAIGTGLKSGGHFIVGGHFGHIDNLDVQFDEQRHCNKRLRSRSHWRRALKDAGFDRVSFQWNPAYLGIMDALPENNLLIARKG